MLQTNMMKNKELASSSFYLLVTFIFLPPSYESNYFFFSSKNLYNNDQIGLQTEINA